jgi:hypothetical protein
MANNLWSTTTTAGAVNTIGIGTNAGAITTIGTGNIALGSSGTSNYTIAQEKTTYYILGEYVEVKGWSDPYLTMAISTLNILKKPYYEELRKNNFKFPQEIENYLKIAFRDDLIDEIIKPTF